MKNTKVKFKKVLKHIISNIAEEYPDNELAYLAITSKIELQLRDKIAFKLHQQYQTKYLICREWSPNSYKNYRVDLAIIEKETSKVLSLIEFKAKAIVRYEEKFTQHLLDDLRKICEIAEDDNVELYYIYFNNIIKSDNEFETIYTHSVKYISELNKNLNSKTDWIEACETNWKKHLHEAKLEPKKSTALSIPAGIYYNRKVVIETFIYGPIKQSDII